jgi:hypothetical protein
MATTFTAKRVSIRELLPPIGNLVEGKTFVDCDIVGPANLFLLDGVSMHQYGGQNVDLVVLDDNVTPWNAIYLKHCDFRKCRFYNITMLTTKDGYKAFWKHVQISCIAGRPTDSEPELPLSSSPTEPIPPQAPS